MFGGGFAEIGFILFLAFLLFGPRKLPEIARTLGKGLRDFRHASDDLKRSLEAEISTIETETNFNSPEPSPNGDEQSELSYQEEQSENRD